jgi:hypothetical protein
MVVGGLVALAVAWVLLMAVLSAVGSAVDGIAASPIPLVFAVVAGVFLGLWFRSGDIPGEPWWARIAAAGCAVLFLAKFPLGGVVLVACAVAGYFSTEILERLRGEARP